MTDVTLIFPDQFCIASGREIYLEGFLRQIMGWREFLRASYLLKGSSQRTSNFFHHQEKIPKGFWDGSVGILPIDTTIKRILKTGYCNHIERLMVLENFLLLTETSPHERSILQNNLFRCKKNNTNQIAGALIGIDGVKHCSLPKGYSTSLNVRFFLFI